MGAEHQTREPRSDQETASTAFFFAKERKDTPLDGGSGFDFDPTPYNPKGAVDAITEAQRKYMTATNIREALKSEENESGVTAWGHDSISYGIEDKVEKPLSEVADDFDAMAQAAVDRCIWLGGEKALIEYHAGKTAVAMQAGPEETVTGPDPAA